MSTPHNAASPGEIAPVVLMAGDPLRAKYIAENFLTDPVCFNTVRGMLGYTGTYQGKRLSVMGHGMGIPSIGIYTYELYACYGVEVIMRIGSCGALQEYLQLKDLILASGACTDSNFLAQYGLPGTFAPIASFDVLEAAARAAERLGVPYHAGNILSSDHFYNETPGANDAWRSMGVLAVEMEAAALYAIAARAGKKALCLLSVSDHIYRTEELLPEERQTGFTNMMKVALETALAF